MTTSSDRPGKEERRAGTDRTVLSRSAGETERLGAELGALLRPGACVLLSGELGSGKTTFLRGMARGLGVDDPESVNSPSYPLVNRYPGPLPLTHVDAYFMRSAEDLDLCGFDDALAAGDVVAVEWADRLFGAIADRERSPRSAIRVGFLISGEKERKIFIENWPEPGAEAQF